MVHAISFTFFKKWEIKMRIIVLMLVAVMMLPVASMGAVGTTDTSDVAKEKVIIGDEACEPVIIGFKERPGKTYRELSDKAYQELRVKRELQVNEHDGKVSHSYRIINALPAGIHLLPLLPADATRRTPLLFAASHASCNAEVDCHPAMLIDMTCISLFTDHSMPAMISLR